MSIVAVAIVLSFHLRKAASDIELRMAKPLGAIFWALSVSCLGVGMANYTSMFRSFSMDCMWWRLTNLFRNGQPVQSTGGHCAERVEDAGGEYLDLVDWTLIADVCRLWVR
jgi:hypothetical protein